MGLMSLIKTSTGSRNFICARINTSAVAIRASRNKTRPKDQFSVHVNCNAPSDIALSSIPDTWKSPFLCLLKIIF